MKKNNIIFLFTLCFLCIFALGAMNLSMIRSVPKGYNSGNATAKGNATMARVIFDIEKPGKSRNFIFGHNGTVAYIAVKYRDNQYNSTNSSQLLVAEDWSYMIANSTDWNATTAATLGVAKGE
jgi:hypothetical protein